MVTRNGLLNCDAIQGWVFVGGVWSPVSLILRCCYQQPTKKTTPSLVKFISYDIQFVRGAAVFDSVSIWITFQWQQSIVHLYVGPSEIFSLEAIQSLMINGESYIYSQVAFLQHPPTLNLPYPSSIVSNCFDFYIIFLFLLLLYLLHSVWMINKLR